MHAQSFTNAVILAGGVGERLWPASTPEHPKQFLSLSDGLSFLQSAILRALATCSGKILIITRHEILAELTGQAATLAENSPPPQRERIKRDLLVISEPSSRHTCPPLVLACKYLEHFDGGKERTILVLTSDQVISPMSSFTSDCQKAAFFARQGKFVCFAIPPYEPSTGFGYIKAGNYLDEGQSVFAIESFKEKPDAATAKHYFESGGYSWNSGMFGFTSSLFMGEIERYEPAMAQAFRDLDSSQPPAITQVNSIACIESWSELEAVYDQVEAISVDNAVAERTVNAVAVKASFVWDDVGSWNSFEKHSGEGGGFVSVESSGNFVFSDLPVALCGVKDLIVVAKNGKILVMKKGTGAFMREIVKLFKEQNEKSE